MNAENFFPWMGFFHKIYIGDAFVFLDHVENNPRSAIYTKRVKIIVNKQEHWLTCSLKTHENKIFVPINQMRLDNPERLKDKHLKTIELNYKKSPFFNDTMPLVQSFYDHKSYLISERNIDIINSICTRLNITTSKFISKDLNIDSSSNQMLINITKSLNGDCYIPGGGADGYQENEMFANCGINIEYQNFKHPQYNQFNAQTFIPGLSIIDALMNIGSSETEKLIKNA